MGIKLESYTEQRAIIEQERKLCAESYLAVLY